uniref:Uncharacterized protein n=1 Tax=Quercus lobata TaxID=97700 RepID=A0A7N2N6Y0_QUELO
MSKSSRIAVGRIPISNPRRQVSYKNSLIGDIPRAYAQAFRFDRDIKEKEVSDTKVERRFWKEWWKSLSQGIDSESEKKLVGTKSTKSFKHFSSSTGSEASAFLKVSESLPKKCNEPIIPSNTQPTQFRVGIWYRNKALAISDKMIAQIRAVPIDMIGWFKEELCVVWKHIFPITSSSNRTGNLPLDRLAWCLTPNPWWKFLTETHLITEKEVEELNRQRRPLIMPHLDESRWLVQERKVIDFSGTVASHMGNIPTMKLFQILASIRKCGLLVCCRDDIVGIQKDMVVWKPNWVASKDLLKTRE